MQTIEIPKNRVKTICRMPLGGGMTKVGAFETRLPILELHSFVDSVGKGRAKLISPLVAECVISNHWRSLVIASPFATSAMIGYEKPGETLGKEIVYRDYEGKVLSLPTHGYSGERGIALLALDVSVRDFKANGHGTILDIPSDRLVPIKEFPDESGWHLPEARAGIPQGKPTKCISSRFLSRTRTSYVGALARGLSFDGHGRDYVIADYGLFYKLGIVVEKASPSP